MCLTGGQKVVVNLGVTDQVHLSLHSACACCGLSGGLRVSVARRQQTQEGDGTRQGPEHVKAQEHVQAQAPKTNNRKNIQ